MDAHVELPFMAMEKCTRQTFLRRSGLAALAAPTALSARGVVGPARAADGNGRGSVPSGSSTVRVLTWEGYAAGAAYRPLARLGVKIQAIAMNDDNVDPINKAGQYDIGTTTVGIFPNFIAAGLIQPLDLSLLPNFKQHLHSLRLYSSPQGPPIPEVSKGKVYGVPFAWGTLGLSYRADKGPGQPKHLDDLLDPAYKGRLAIVDDPIQVIQAVSRSLRLGGTDPFGNHPAPLFLTKAQLERVFKKLEKFKAQARSIYPTYGALVTAYARGEIIAALPDWAPDAVAATKGGIKVKVTFPPDMSQSYVDSFFISSKVRATKQMYAFLNQALSASTQFSVGKSLEIAMTNGQAMRKLAASGPAWSVYKNPDQVFKVAPYVVNPPVSSKRYVTTSELLARWEQFKK
jgi:spermidine/putrescine transport system substrate-binding protein